MRSASLRDMTRALVSDVATVHVRRAAGADGAATAEPPAAGSGTPAHPAPRGPPGWAPHSGPPPPNPYGAPNIGPPTSDERTMALLIHVSGIFTGFIGPLIIGLIKKDESAFVDRHGKTALNFFFTLMIAAFVSAILIIVLIGILLLLAVMVIGIVFPIMAAVKANNGEEYTYPMSITFFS